MERGFKSYTEGLATELRFEMGLAPHDPICAFALARHLAVRVMTFGELIPIAISNGSMTPGRLKALNEEVHGLCIPWKAGRAIVHNDSRSPQRQQSDVAHEVAHVLLAHPISELHVNTGATMRNNEHEKEAVWLGGVLLVPKPAAIRGLRSGLSNAAAAKFYGISEQLWTWRCNASGASLIARRRAAAPA